MFENFFSNFLGVSLGYPFGGPSSQGIMWAKSLSFQGEECGFYLSRCSDESQESPGGAEKDLFVENVIQPLMVGCPWKLGCKSMVRINGLLQPT